MQSKEININADFLTFKNQIVAKLDKQYFGQAELFFVRDKAQAKQGLLHSAISDGKFALDLTTNQEFNILSGKGSANINS